MSEITMSDVRLMAGEGKLSPRDVLAGCNAVLRMRNGGAGVGSAPATLGWQPIETAPKDGTQVLLWADIWEMTWGVQMGYFCDAKHRWETYEGSVVDNDDEFDPDDECDEEDFDIDKNTGPTHWMPIPAPPLR